MGILKNIARIGNVTSSEIVGLTTNGKAKDSFGKSFYTYVEECNMERKLERSLSDESNARPLIWGKMVEKVVFDKLPTDYIICSDVTITHPEISYWAGSPDAKKATPVTVCDVKSPLTLKSFCRLVEPLYMGLNGMEAMQWIRDNHPPDGEKYYWQLVSNAIITGAKIAELIVYVPYLKDLETIREYARAEQGNKHFWIANGTDDELPHLINNGYYNDINIITFQIPEFDKTFLTNRVLEAGKLLIQMPK